METLWQKLQAFLLFFARLPVAALAIAALAIIAFILFMFMFRAAEFTWTHVLRTPW